MHRYDDHSASAHDGAVAPARRRGRQAAGRRTTASRDVLSAALRDAGAALARSAFAMGSPGGDPLRLALPVLAPTSGWTPPPEVRGAYAALYLHAELEQAGVLSAVEALAERRYALSLAERSTAAKLERFAQEVRNFPSPTERAVIHARLFGIGHGTARAIARPDQGLPGGASDETAPSPGGARIDFMQRLLRLACSIVRLDSERALLGGAPGLSSQAAWHAASQAMMALIAAEPGGSLVQWARRIHARTLSAFEVLGDAGLMRQLGTSTPWQTLQRLLPPGDAVRRDEAARRGAAGQTLLRRLTTAPGQGGSSVTLPDATTVQAAIRWLVASGLPFSAGGRAPGAAPNLTAALPRTARAASADPLVAGALPEDIWEEALLP